MQTDNNAISRRGIYLLPSLFTTAGLFSGFFGIVSAINGKFEIAVIAVLVAMVMDGLDGRIARMTSTQSKFGAEYDSLADMVSFGMAPALICFIWGLHSLGKLGWFAAFVYVAGGALRLARFNAQIGSQEKRYFQGLASPAAAALVMGFMWFVVDSDFKSTTTDWVSLGLVTGAGILMVSNIRYHSFKEINFKDRIPFVLIFTITLVIALISIDPAKLIFLMFLAYATSGPVFTLWSINKKRRNKKSGFS